MIVWQDMVNGDERYHHWFVTYLANVMSWPGLTMKDNHSRLLSRQNQDGRNEFVREVKETIKLLKNHPSICIWVAVFIRSGVISKMRLMEFIHMIGKSINSQMMYQM